MEEEIKDRCICQLIPAKWSKHCIAIGQRDWPNKTQIGRTEQVHRPEGGQGILTGWRWIRQGNSIIPPFCMDVVSAKPQPATTPEGGKKVASNINEKMRHHMERRFLRSHHRLQQHEVSLLQHLGIAIHQHLRAPIQSSTKWRANKYRDGPAERQSLTWTKCWERWWQKWRH